MSSSTAPGYSARELQQSPYAAFYRPEIAPLSEAARRALAQGALPPDELPGVEAVGDLVERRVIGVHTGFSIMPDGERRVFERTDMPGVDPQMWDWWFAWHGDEAAKYKLWHPGAHIDASWADGRGDVGEYVGRTSHIVELIGRRKMKGAIRFTPPAALGIDEAGLRARGEVCICARIGPKTPAVDVGWLARHVYPVPGGAQMQSFFWLAGRHIAARSGGALASSLLRAAARVTGAARQINAAELLEHCAEEMKHLSLILPDLYAVFGNDHAAQFAETEAAQ